MPETPSPYEGTVAVTSLAHTDGAVTLVEGQTFCLSGRTGDLNPDMPHGLFVLDTRVLSCWQLRINGYRIEPLTVDVPSPFSAMFVGRVHPAAGRADSDVVVFRERNIGQGMRDLLTVTNYGSDPVAVVIELTADVDFADLFEVKEHREIPRDGITCTPRAAGLTFRDTSTSVEKTVAIDVGSELERQGTTFVRSMTLAPRETWEGCLQITTAVAGEELAPWFGCGATEMDALPARRLASWRATMPVVDTDDELFDRALHRASEDLGALRIFDPDHPEVPIVAAGAPWFMTVFGRDSLLTASMSLIAEPRLAEGVLETLARFQGDDVNPDTEEEPGKILHEMRFGAAARPSLSSGEVYYGSIDATPLFVMLLGELRRWGLADETVDRLLPHADRALAWIEDFGDRDGDGYVEYARHTSRGLANQGWKDSWDGVRFMDGRFPEPPIALCEVQGYVYSAYLARAHFAWEHSDAETYEKYSAKATALYERFNEDFWLDEHGWYALGLDADKQPIDALASNMGHCLWTGIVDPEKATLVAEKLMSPEMFSGWGIRTLATSMTAFNPVSYHNGSVWPHDNALIAAGLMRYGFVDEAHRVIRAQLDVAAAYDGRLPELFAGFERGRPATPASYPTSCSPQAWAAASPMLWLRTLLRLDPSVIHGELRVDPALPAWMQRLEVRDIEMGGETVTISVEHGVMDVTGAGHLRVEHEARPPLTAP
ncbi:MAG: glycogen debranching N-terminal domain-containing protein [Acidimicrobiia bacterium]